MAHKQGIFTFRRFTTILFFFIVTITLYKFSKPSNSSNVKTSSISPTVHLILATTTGRDSSWTEKLTIPNLTIIPYFADDPTSLYHPPQNKGHESIMYLTYLRDFYLKLPDISILIHGDDYTWHIDGALEYSTLQALNRLDLLEVQKKGYINLRSSWENACPNWINTSTTTSSPNYDEHMRPEEPFIAAAFQAVFPGEEVPEILAQPCCSQFAISKAAILRNDKVVFERGIKWIEETELEDSNSGRIWEHLWQYLFLGEAVDCQEEWRVLCRFFHVCFEGRGDLGEWSVLEQRKKGLFDKKWGLIGGGEEQGSEVVKKVDEEMEELERVVKPWRERAILRGVQGGARRRLLGESWDLR